MSHLHASQPADSQSPPCVTPPPPGPLVACTHLLLSPSLSSHASWTPVDLPEGTAARNMPCSVHRSTSTVGCRSRQQQQGQGEGGTLSLARPRVCEHCNAARHTHLATGVENLPSLDVFDGRLRTPTPHETRSADRQPETMPCGLPRQTHHVVYFSCFFFQVRSSAGKSSDLCRFR